MASGAKTAPLPSLAAIRPAVTAASIRSPDCPRPTRLQRWNPMQARVIGCKGRAARIILSQADARSAKGSAPAAIVSGSRRSRKPDRSSSGPGPPVRRRTAHPRRARAPVSFCTPDRRNEIQSASRSAPTRWPTNQLRSAASNNASRCRHLSGPRRSRSSKAPSRPVIRARPAAQAASDLIQSETIEVSMGSALGPGGR